MLWYRELGFHNNPFSIKPAQFKNAVTGYDLKGVFDKIDKGQMLFLEGQYGFGKTTILKHLIRAYGGRKEVIYYNCNRAESTIGTESLLKGKYGRFMRIFSGLPDNMILLLDEVEKLSQEDQ